ncbi:outer membrane beta-barrel protein [uncultured Helicobacter sp.]|uniref:outer membrane beta-barrel protein n=3 Tax=uncultured Helicobacter sp. TaxID=175537 RepID=UPI0025EEBC38|nr:outer membrane beta-barrel protein [uncultured Helicobacter sp.]
MMKKLFLCANCLCVSVAYAGHSGFFIGGSLSLNNTHYSGVYSTQDNGTTTHYPHGNDSHNAFGLSAQLGYQRFSADARFGARFYIEYNDNGYAKYIDEANISHKMDAYGLALNVDLLFELLQMKNATLGVFAGGGVMFNTQTFTKTHYSIYQEDFTSAASLKGYGLSAQAGVSLTFNDKHRIELEIKRSNLVSDYDSGYIYVGAQAESLKLEAQGFLSYRLNYAYVF